MFFTFLPFFDFMALFDEHNFCLFVLFFLLSLFKLYTNLMLGLLHSCTLLIRHGTLHIMLGIMGLINLYFFPMTHLNLILYMIWDCGFSIQPLARELNNPTRGMTFMFSCRFSSYYIIHCITLKKL